MKALKVVLFSILISTVLNAQVADTALVREVYQNLIAFIEPSEIPDNVNWPPPLLIINQDVVNAFAAYNANTKNYEIRFMQGMLEKVCKGNKDYIAFVLAHEIAHILLEHPNSARHKRIKKYGNLIVLAFGRAAEKAADSLGYILAARAGYDPEVGILSLKEMQRYTGTSGATWEYLSDDHYSTYERLQFLSRYRKKYYSSLLAFTNGVYLLKLEKYKLAELIFRELTEEYPECAECWANLGYALLMQYINKFEVENLAERNIGYIYFKGFYSYSEYLFSYRGIEEDLWYEAVGAFREALRLNPKQTLVYLNMGIAYLFHPKGKDLGNAEKYFSKVQEMVEQDALLTDYEKLVVYVNLSGYFATVGDESNYRAYFKNLKFLQESTTLLGIAETYNELYFAVISSTNRANNLNKDGILRLFHRFLSTESNTSLWWKYVYDTYVEWCNQNGYEPRSEASFASKHAAYKKAFEVKLDESEDLIIYIGMPLNKTKQKIAEYFQDIPVERPLLPEYNIKEIRFPKGNIALVGSDQVLFIRIYGKVNFPVVLEQKGVGGGQTPFYVGMSWDEVIRYLGELDWEPVSMKVRGKRIKYYYYPNVGVGFRVKEGKVVEILIGQTRT